MAIIFKAGNMDYGSIRSYKNRTKLFTRESIRDKFLSRGGSLSMLPKRYRTDVDQGKVNKKHRRTRCRYVGMTQAAEPVNTLLDFYGNTTSKMGSLWQCSQCQMQIPMADCRIQRFPHWKATTMCPRCHTSLCFTKYGITTGRQKHGGEKESK